MTEKCEVSVAQLSSQNMNLSGVVAAEECGMSVALLNKSSVCAEPSNRISEVQTNSTQKSQEIANTEARKIANPKGGKVGFLGKAGPSKGVPTIGLEANCLLICSLADVQPFLLLS